MPVMDEFREEREALKHGTLKEKLSYFFYYYKWHVITVVLVLIAVSTLISQMLSRKDTALYIALINAIDVTPDADLGFEKYAGIDADSEEVIYDTTMRIDFTKMTEETINSTEKFVVYLAAADLDVVISDTDIIRQYAHSETFYNLRDFLTPEQYEAYSPYFYYMDQSVVDAKNAAQAAYDYDFVPVYPDPRHPEDMVDPIPVGIYLTDCTALTDRFYFINTDLDIVLSVTLNTKKPETASAYIDFLMQ